MRRRLTTVEDIEDTLKCYRARSLGYSELKVEQKRAISSVRTVRDCLAISTWISVVSAPPLPRPLPSRLCQLLCQQVLYVGKFTT